MKVKFTQLVAYMKGRSDNTVLFAAPSKTFGIARRYVYPTITDNNRNKGIQMRNLATFYHAVSATYLLDLQAYARQYYSEHQDMPDMQIASPNPFAHLMRMCFNWSQSDPEHVDLGSITVADAVALDADVRTIKRAVEAGFLPVVSGYLAWTAGIQ